MKSPPFSYRAAASVREAAGVLAEFGTGAVVLAGGQSLLTDLHFRRLHPAVVLDINRAGELASVAGLGRMGADWRDRPAPPARAGRVR